MNDPTDHEDHRGDDQLREEEQPEDRLLGELARTGAEEDDIARERLDERWDRLSSGELSEQEAAELMALAEASEEGHQAFEAFRPLGEEFYQRVSDQAREALVGSSTAGEPKGGSEPRSPQRLDEASPVRYGPWRPSRWDPLPTAIAAVLVVAVGLGIWWGMAAKTLPAYSVEGLTGSATVRGTAADVGECPTYRPGDTVEIVLRPETAVEGLALILQIRCADSPDIPESYGWGLFREHNVGVNQDGVVHLTGILLGVSPGSPELCRPKPGEPEVWILCLGAMRAVGDYNPAEICARAPLGDEPVAQGKATVLKTHLCIQRPSPSGPGE